MRYWTMDVPPQHPGAYSPIMPMTPIASSHGLVDVQGGTVNVFVGVPGVHTTSPDIHTQGSHNVPPYIRPSIYFTRLTNHVGHTMPNRIANILPAPALTAPGAFGKIAARQPGIAMRRPKIGGRQAIPWPRAFQRFGSTSDG